MKTQAETIADPNARCAGPDQSDNFDRAFRKSLTVPKEAILREDARRKRAAGKEAGKENRLTAASRSVAPYSRYRRAPAYPSK
jgi:hypothetical protein